MKFHESSGVMFETVVSGEDDLSTANRRMMARIEASVTLAKLVGYSPATGTSSEPGLSS